MLHQLHKDIFYRLFPGNVFYLNRNRVASRPAVYHGLHHLFRPKPMRSNHVHCDSTKDPTYEKTKKNPGHAASSRRKTD